MKKISIILPTKGRSALVARLFESIMATTADLDAVEVVLYLDDDDVESHGIGHPALDIIRLIGPRGAALGRILNECYRASTGRYVFLMNDDVVFRTKGWDRSILNAFARFPDDIAMVYGNDLDQRARVPTFPVLSRGACEAMGGVCPPEYLNLHIESHLLDVFKRLRLAGHDRLVYLDDVVFEHMHFQLGKQPYDETCRKRNQDLDDWRFLLLDAERERVSKRLEERIGEYWLRRAQAKREDARRREGAPEVSPPEVSIVIPDLPAGAAFDASCLESVKDEDGRDVRFEVIAAADWTYATIPGVDLKADYAVKVLANSGALTSAEAANECAKLGEGEFLVFLGFHARPLRGWLGALLKAIKSDPGRAVAGAKHLEPRNGRVSHVGVCFYEEGGVLKSTHVYNGMDASHPAVTRQREFQAVEPLCMMVRKSAFIDAGGFDADMKEAAGLDLCLRLREMGWKIVYAPESCVMAGYSCVGRAWDDQRQYSEPMQKWNGRVELDLDRILEEDGIAITRNYGSFAAR